MAENGFEYSSRLGSCVGAQPRRQRRHSPSKGESHCPSAAWSRSDGKKTQVGMNGDTFAKKAPKECSTKFVATLKGKSLAIGNALEYQRKYS